MGARRRARDGRTVISEAASREFEDAPEAVRDIPTSVDPGHLEEIKIA